MTKEITKSNILQEVQDKFAMREYDPTPFLFDETVVPVYEIGQHLKHVERITKTVSVTATGGAWIFTVAAQEQWNLQRYNVIFVTGAYTVAGVFIGRPHVADYVYLDLAAAQSVSYAHDLPKSAVLNPGDGIYVNIDGYTSTGNLTLICDVIKETIR